MAKPYTTNTISGYNSSPPSDDGALEAQNEITWAGIKTKLADPIKTLAEAINTDLVTALGTDIDLDGDARLILDTDADTIIDAAAVDDRIDIAIGGTDFIHIGHATGNTGAVFHLDPGAFTSTANTDIGLVRVGNSNAVTIPAGTTAVVASMYVDTGNWTATGTIASTAGLYIAGAATEGTNNYSIYANGQVLFADTGSMKTTMLSTSDGTLAGPLIEMIRRSPTPADNDLIGSIAFLGHDDGANDTIFGRIKGKMIDVTDTTEDGEILFDTTVAGTTATRLHLGAGLYTAGATSGDQGVDTINASTYYSDGTAGVSAGPFTTISSITVTGGIVTALTGS